MANERSNKPSRVFKSTEIGRLNRKIEQSVSDVFRGEHGAAGRALDFAKQREDFLIAKVFRKKITA